MSKHERTTSLKVTLHSALQGMYQESYEVRLHKAWVEVNRQYELELDKFGAVTKATSDRKRRIGALLLIAQKGLN